MAIWRITPAADAAVGPSSVLTIDGAAPSLPAIQELAMYLARFSYDVLPVNRQRAIDFIRREAEAARSEGLNARLLVPLTRGHGGVALQFEVELTKFYQLDQFRNRGIGSSNETGGWMHAFSEVLVSPPGVEILRVDEPRQRAKAAKLNGPIGRRALGPQLTQAIGASTRTSCAPPRGP